MQFALSQWFRGEQHSILLILNITVLLGIATGWLLYFTIGQQVIEATYHGPWVEFLHKALMMEGQSILSLDHYYRRCAAGFRLTAHRQVSAAHYRSGFGFNLRPVRRLGFGDCVFLPTRD
jgi:hypothetical protein